MGSETGTMHGRLKIFFGMAPGVGKTFAMLAAAQRMAAQGVDVVVGIVETHGRIETEQMLLGLDILPRRAIEHRGTTAGGEASTSAGVVLREFDPDAAIARRPDILLVDELAHTNAPGSAREKRWQDVHECLKAGINVYTTLNVQHLESLNDVVSQITGVRVRETVPDAVFDEADEVELVDLPPEVLHERLRAGKVYLGENAARAVDPDDGFFRKGNLTALRELALRRTAAWVDSELRRYKRDRGIRAVWPAGERILVAVSPSPFSANLIRAAKRMAAGLHADLLAAYVETPSAADLHPSQRDRLLDNMRLAESLGAVTSTLSGHDAATELIAFARSRNVSRIVVGKTARSRWQDAIDVLFKGGSFIGKLIRQSGDIDIAVVRGDENAETARTRRSLPTIARSPHGSRTLSENLVRFGSAAVLVLASAAIALTFYRPPDLSEESLIMLGGVVMCALWLGRGPAVFATALAVLAFNFLFTEPRFTLYINDSGYLLTFGIMVLVGMIVGTLAAQTREQARAAWRRERHTAALYALSRELGASQDAREVAMAAARHVHDTLSADVVVAIAGGAKPVAGLDVLACAGAPDWFDDREKGVAQWAMDNAQQAGAGTQRLPASAGRYIPLIGTGGKVGLLGLRLVKDSPRDAAIVDGERLVLLDAIASQTASALERVMLSDSQQAARLEAERERLRSALLSSVSHDLRTPLASITGAASTLEEALAPGDGAVALDPATRASLLRTIVEEASRLNDIVANLVFATRLESGAISLKREWTTVEEVVGVGLSRHRADLASRPFRVQLPADLPMIRVDNAMLPQVLHNLVENALHYTQPGTPISVSAWKTDERIIVKVADEGPGLAEHEESKVFQRFYRGRASKVTQSTTGSVQGSTGMGLGLTICDGIVRAHGGRIWAEPNVPRGVAFLFWLPIEYPQPATPVESVSELVSPIREGRA